MPKGETPPIDRGVEGPPSEAEQQLLQGLTQLDALRARGDAVAVRQFLAAHPDIQTLYDARRKIMKTGVLAPAATESRPTPEAMQEQEIERVHQKLVEAWNAAEEATARARASGGSKGEDLDTVFNQTLAQTLGEEYAKAIDIKRWKSAYAIAGYKGKAFIFPIDPSRLDHKSPSFQKLFDCPPQPRGECFKLVRAARPTFMREQERYERNLLEGKLTIDKLDGHEVKRGKVE